MRDIALFLGFVAMLLPAFRYPHVGVLLWCWTAMAVPTYYVWSFMGSVSLNKIAAAATLMAWLASREPKKLPMSSTLALLAMYAVLGTLSVLFRLPDTDVGFREWEKFVKILLFAFAIAGIVKTKNHVDSVLYAIFISLGFHGVLGGAKFLATGGSHKVWGPGDSIIGDNNHFALAMTALLPIVFYLYKQSDRRAVRLALIGSSILVMASIMGTSSRGGLIGIAALGGYALLRTRKKLKYLLAIIPLVAAAVAFAPASWTSRMDTIAGADEDSSFMLRVIAWKQSAMIALDHPILGGGFHAVQDRKVWADYAFKFDSALRFIQTPPINPSVPRAAHSIYFQVLGDMGFLGLMIFIAILVSSWRNSSAVIRNARNRPEWLWASDLATALQYSLVAYIISGAALGMAYFDYIFVVFALLVVVRSMVEVPLISRRFGEH